MNKYRVTFPVYLDYVVESDSFGDAKSDAEKILEKDLLVSKVNFYELFPHIQGYQLGDSMTDEWDDTTHEVK